MMKALIIYYSLGGNTRLIAEILTRGLKGDLCPLELKKEIGSDLLSRYFLGGGQALIKAKPKLQSKEINFANYNLIVIGTPVWFYNLTPPIRAFLGQKKIKGKKVALFCTHRGHPGKTLEKMEKELVGNQIVASADFKDVLKEKEKNLKKAKQWSRKLKNSLLG